MDVTAPSMFPAMVELEEGARAAYRAIAERRPELPPLPSDWSDAAEVRIWRARLDVWGITLCIEQERDRPFESRYYLAADRPQRGAWEWTHDREYIGTQSLDPLAGRLSMIRRA